MIAAVAAAPVQAPSLEDAIFAALTRARAVAEDPIAVLAGAAAESEKLAAIRALHAGLPAAKLARQNASLEALRRAGADKTQTVEVRRQALLHLGYGAAAAGDDAARAKAATALLDAAAESAVAEAALRGLAPATHGVPESAEDAFFKRLLDVSLGIAPTRALALQSLQAFIASRDDLPKRKPNILTALDARLLKPIENDPAAFVANGDAAARAFTLATLWKSARHREAAKNAAPTQRLQLLLEKLRPLENDTSVSAQIAAYLAAGPAVAP